MQAHRDDEFEAVVVEATDDGATMIIVEPPVEARCLGTGLVDGSTITVRVRDIDPESRTVTYEVAARG